MTASLLFLFAKWINADLRTPQYFLQFASILLGSMLLGVGMGSVFPGTFTCVALAQDNTTLRPQSGRTLMVEISGLRSNSAPRQD